MTSLARADPESRTAACDPAEGMGLDRAEFLSVGIRLAKTPADKQNARELLGTGLYDIENPAEIVKLKKRL